MSLVNDALKRAKAAQQQRQQSAAADLPPLHFRPAEHSPESVRRAGLLMPILLAAVALAGLFLVWQTYQRSHQSPVVTVAAASPQPPEPASAVPGTPAPAPASAPAPSPAPLGSASSAPGSGSATSTPPGASAAVPAPAISAPDAAPEPATNSSSSPAPATSPSPAPIAEPPKPAPPRLQAIVYSPTRPSALIGGRTLFLGDHIGDQRVQQITQDTVTLVGNGQTNVLTLLY
jgi:hypothetical protein